jgi:hypothetical protein
MRCLNLNDTSLVQTCCPQPPSVETGCCGWNGEEGWRATRIWTERADTPVHTEWLGKTTEQFRASHALVPCRQPCPKRSAGCKLMRGAAGRAQPTKQHTGMLATSECVGGGCVVFCVKGTGRMAEKGATKPTPTNQTSPHTQPRAACQTGTPACPPGWRRLAAPSPWLPRCLASYSESSRWQQHMNGASDVTLKPSKQGVGGQNRWRPL